MPTVEVWTVGTGGDYSTPQLAEDDLPASLVAADKQIDISLFNEEWASSSTTTFAGVTADSTRYLRVIADDPPDRRSLPLRYNTSAGPCIRETAGFKAAVVCSIPYTRWLNIQIKGEGEGLRITDGTSNVLIDQCLVSATWRNIEAVGTVSGLVVQNTALIRHTTGGQQAWYQDFGSGTSYNNTIVRPSNLSVGGSGFYNSFFTLTVRNTVVTGFSSFSDATPGTSATNAGSMASVPGSGSLTSLTPSDLFEEPDNTSGALDLRLLSTSDLIGAGTDLSGSGVTTDYSGATRPTPYDIGAWQYSISTDYPLSADGITREYSFGDATFTRGRTLTAEGLTRFYSFGDAVFTGSRSITAEGLSRLYSFGDASITLGVPSTGDTHDGFKRRSRRERALDAAAERQRQEWIAERNGLRLALEAAMGMAAEVVEDAPPVAVEAVQAAEQAARVVAPSLSAPAMDLAPVRAALERLHAAVEEAARLRALAEDDEEVMMLLRAL